MDMPHIATEDSKRKNCSYLVFLVLMLMHMLTHIASENQLRIERLLLSREPLAAPACPRGAAH